MKNRARKNKISFFLFVVAFLCLLPSSRGQDKPAYRIFTSEGKEVQYSKVIKSLTKAEIVLFGELHNNPIAHWLELEIAKSLYADNADLLIAMEMFEADDQIIVDEYVGGLIDEKNFLKEAKLWDNYSTDYKPLVEFARKNRLKVVASNIPRRYANLVYKNGLAVLDSLSDQSLKWMAPLPIEVDLDLPGYKSMMNEMKGHGGGNVENLARSQGAKDATMAYFILQHKTENNAVFHINGAYHSQDREGIVCYLKKSNPGLSIETIHVAEQSEIEKLDSANESKADYIICIPQDMTKTY